MSPSNAAPALPEVTEAHRIAAFEAMGWTGWSYEQARASDTRRRVIEARAHHLRTQEWLSTQSRTVQTVRRCHPATGQWATQQTQGPWVDAEPDLFPQHT